LVNEFGPEHVHKPQHDHRLLRMRCIATEEKSRGTRDDPECADVTKCFLISNAKGILSFRTAPDLFLARAFDEIEIVNDGPVCAALEGLAVVDVGVRSRGPVGGARHLAEVVIEVDADC
jgi:hypothetical protein